MPDVNPRLLLLALEDSRPFSGRGAAGTAAGLVADGGPAETGKAVPALTNSAAFNAQPPPPAGRGIISHRLFELEIPDTDLPRWLDLLVRPLAAGQPLAGNGLAADDSENYSAAPAPRPQDAPAKDSHSHTSKELEDRASDHRRRPPPPKPRPRARRPVLPATTSQHAEPRRPPLVRGTAGGGQPPLRPPRPTPAPRRPSESSDGLPTVSHADATAGTKTASAAVKPKPKPRPKPRPPPLAQSK
jgi:hypothetical protein